MAVNQESYWPQLLQDKQHSEHVCTSPPSVHAGRLLWEQASLLQAGISAVRDPIVEGGFVLRIMKNLICGSHKYPFLSHRLKMYAEAVHGVSGALQICVGFNDGFNIYVARPGGNGMQRVSHSRHERKHSIKYHFIDTPDGLFTHVTGPMERRRHASTLYLASGLDEQLRTAIFDEDYQYMATPSTAIVIIFLCPFKVPISQLRSSL